MEERINTRKEDKYFQDQVYESMEPEISADKAIGYAMGLATIITSVLLAIRAAYAVSQCSERTSYFNDSYKPAGIESRIDYFA